MKTFMRYAGLIVASFGAGALAVMMYQGAGNFMSYVETIVLILTLSVLTRYAFDTNRLAEASEEQVSYSSTPVVKVSVAPWLVEAAEREATDIRAVSLIANDSRHHLEVKVQIVLQYGVHSSVHKDSYYSGETTWHIGPNDSSNGNFEILSFFKDIGDTSESMKEKLKNTDKHLSIYIFSKFRIYGSKDKSYSRNMTRIYSLKNADVPSHVVTEENWNLLPYKWVLEFKSPPDDITALAWKTE